MLNKTKAKRLIKQALIKLDKKGSSDGSVKLGKYIVDINASGALGFEGVIGDTKAGFLVASFEYSTIKTKYIFKR